MLCEELRYNTLNDYTELVNNADTVDDPCFSDTSCDERFYIVWSKESSKFHLWHLRSVESILYHHAKACICVYSNTLPVLWFNQLWLQGYHIWVVPYSLSSMIKARNPDSPWLKRINDKLYITPLADVHVGAILLYKYGGIYWDTSLLLLQPVSIRNTIGLNYCQKQQFCITVAGLNEVKITYGDPASSFVAQSSFMIFDPGHPFIAELLSMFDTHDYRKNEAVSASQFLTTILSNGNTGVVAQPPSVLYPIAWWKSWEQYNWDTFDIIWWQLKHYSTTIQIFDKMPADLVPQLKQLAEVVASEFALSDYPLTISDLLD